MSAQLCKPIAPSRRLYSGKKDSPSAVYESWNKVGEPGSAGERMLTVGRLKAAVLGGDLLPQSGHTAELLQVLEDYIIPGLKKGGLWGIPLLRVLVPPPPPPEHGSSTVTLKLEVYASRLLFYLIAGDGVKLIFNHITPSTANVVQPLELVQVHAPVFSSTFDAERSALQGFDFTLAGLLKSTENCGHAEAVQPAGVLLQLKQYQRMGLQFMTDKECSPRGVNGMLWEERGWGGLGGGGGGGGGGRYYYSPLLGELRLGADIPPVVRGGLLCDEMGMGKTIVVASRIVLDKEAGYPPCRGNRLVVEAPTPSAPTPSAPAPAPAPALTPTRSAPTLSAATPGGAGNGALVGTVEPGSNLLYSNTTLVVAPTSLLTQWDAELKKCTQHGLLSIGSYTMDELQRDKGNSVAARARRAATVQSLCKLDVVLTSYSCMEADKNVYVNLSYQPLYTKRI
jgi:E3 ubiquitin-protein ligase SHPRH